MRRFMFLKKNCVTYKYIYFGIGENTKDFVTMEANKNSKIFYFTDF